MTPTKVIGFFGVAQSGKSTAAHFAAEWFRKRGHQAQVRSFAGPLKDGLAVMGIHKDTNLAMYREAAQLMGTEICRKHDTDWWVEQMRKEITSLPEGSIVFIDDCRFPNERDFLRDDAEAEFFVMKVGNRIDLTDPIYQHASEELGLLWENEVSRWGISSKGQPQGKLRVLDNSESVTLTQMMEALELHLIDIESRIH